MKKRVLAMMVSLLTAILLVCGCFGQGDGEKQNKKEEIPPLKASEVLTLEQAGAVIDNSYILTVKDADQTEGAKQTTLYVSQETGAGYPIEVVLYQPGTDMSAEDIKALYDDMRAKRPKGVDLADFGADAFIAYPSITFYKDGYMVRVTAGGGNDDAQNALLEKAGKTALENVNAYIAKRNVQ